MQEIWTAVDEYVAGLLVSEGPALETVAKENQAAGLPAIAISPPQGKLLYLLACAIRATDILEFGTLGAYSTIWLARALPSTGRLTTLEADPGYAEVAHENIDRAGLRDRVDLRVGKALDLLPKLAAEEAGPFDLTFIDADKEHTPEYFAWVLERTRPGGLIVADNVVRDGTLADEGSDEPKVKAQRHLHEIIAADPRVSATTIQTVGAKGYDGFTLALVEG